MKNVGIAIHLILFSFETSSYYILNKFNIVGIRYIWNQIDYYKELPIVNFILILTFLLAASIPIVIPLCKKKRSYSYLLIYPCSLIVLYVLKGYTTTQIITKYGTEYFFCNFYWYFFGCVFGLAILHLLTEKYLENLADPTTRDTV